MPENPTSPPEHGLTDNPSHRPPATFGGGFSTRCAQCQQPTVVDGSNKIVQGCRHHQEGQTYGA